MDKEERDIVVKSVVTSVVSAYFLESLFKTEFQDTHSFLLEWLIKITLAMIVVVIVYALVSLLNWGTNCIRKWFWERM